MKKFLVIKFLIIIIALFSSCAKPKVVNVVETNDEKLNCEQLKEAIAESQKVKREAEFAQGGTGGNITRMVLFWPAWAQTIHNADVAIRAAQDRNFHLVKLMKNKKCKGAKEMYAEITETGYYKNTIANQLKDLNEMYQSGILTKEEFDKAKKKTLNQ